MKKAFITGVTGQDGSYLAEFLLKKGYEVHGIVRRSSLINTERVDHLADSKQDFADRLHIHYGDLADASSLQSLMTTIQPDEVYNLGAQSHVKVSFEMPLYTADVDALGTLRLLEAVRQTQESTGKEIRFYQAGTSEMFGAANPPQNEATAFYPRSPYGCSKVAAYWYGVNYRESYNIFVANGILFNHESPRRGETFVTRKITRAATRIKMGLQNKLFLGNLDSKRDWGFAGDFVEGMWLMLQQPKGGDYVLATGYSYSVREFLDEAFGQLELDWHDYVEIDPQFYRPAEVEHLHGDASKAKKDLGWQPKVDLKGLVKMMVDHDLQLAKQEKVLADAGFETVAKGAASGIDGRGMVLAKNKAS